MKGKHASIVRIGDIDVEGGEEPVVLINSPDKVKMIFLPSTRETHLVITYSDDGITQRKTVFSRWSYKFMQIIYDLMTDDNNNDEAVVKLFDEQLEFAFRQTYEYEGEIETEVRHNTGLINGTKLFGRQLMLDYHTQWLLAADIDTEEVKHSIICNFISNMTNFL